MGPKWRLMPDKGTAVNGVFIALTIVFFVLCIFLGIVIGQMQRLSMCHSHQSRGLLPTSDRTTGALVTRYNRRTASLVN